MGTASSVATWRCGILNSDVKQRSRVPTRIDAGRAADRPDEGHFKIDTGGEFPGGVVEAVVLVTLRADLCSRTEFATSIKIGAPHYAKGSGHKKW